MQEVSDIYQERYLDHQENRKPKTINSKVKREYYTELEVDGLVKILEQRKSTRKFNGKLKENEIYQIISMAKLAPSSCNRKAIDIIKCPDNVRDVLVGGKGWCHKKCTVLLFKPNIDAYKSPYERDFMPYLDTGFMAQNIYLYCEAVGLGCCYINPNTYNMLETNITGAMAIGKLF